MPYQWNDSAGPAPYIGDAQHGSDAPLASLRLWPHRPLGPRGFVAAIGLLFGLGLMPVLALLGTLLIWVILGFTLITLAALWIALRASYHRGLGEHLLFYRDRIELTRTNPRGPVQTWHANPYWVTIALRAEGGPVEDYLTLKGDGREVELGAFLSPDERRRLRDDLAFVLGQINDTRG